MVKALGLSLAMALLGAGCRGPSSVPSGHAASPIPGVKMDTSADAAAVVERARRIHAVPPRTSGGFPSVVARPVRRSLMSASSAEARIVGSTIRAYLGAGRPATTEVAYPMSAQQPSALKLASGAALSLALRDTTAAPAEYANGYIVYRGGMSAGADMIVRPSRDGFEDDFLFDKKPEARRIEYDLALPPAVAGLRLSSNILELVDAKGTPLLHASSPFLVDSAGKATKAKIAVAGCAFDQSAQPTWGRKPTPPGASSCRVSITWDDTNVQYPALLDPSWETAAAMPIAAPFWNDEVLAGRDSAADRRLRLLRTMRAAQNTTLFFDVDSGTWSVGPPTVVARARGQLRLLQRHQDE